MKAKLITYSTENLTSTQRSILSKRINGYIDKSNNARYIYKRKGFIAGLPHVKVTNKTFIIREKDFSLINKELRKLGASIKSWDIVFREL